MAQPQDKDSNANVAQTEHPVSPRPDPNWVVDSGMIGRSLRKLRWVILAIALLFVLLGIFRGDVAMVFRKAATLCLECIGIG